MTRCGTPRWPAARHGRRRHTSSACTWPCRRTGTLRTGSRGCCSRRTPGPRRVATSSTSRSMFGIRRPLKEDSSTTSWSPTRVAKPEPMRPLQRADQVLGPFRQRIALVSTPSPPGTTRWSMAPAPRRRRRQGPVLRAGRADRRAVAARGVPIGDTPKPQIREEAANRGLPPDKPTVHDICSSRPVTPSVPSAPGSGYAAGRVSRWRRTCCQHMRAWLHHRPAKVLASRPGPDGVRRY